MVNEKCSVEECQNPAAYQVILYDVYVPLGDVFFEEDFTCPRICRDHMIENESKAKGVREPRGDVEYPYTNRNQAQGFTIYRPLA